jgi:hypothetical protein
VSVDYNLTVRTNRLQQVINAIDAGPSNGFLLLLDISGNTLSSMQLSRPSGVATLGVMTFQGLPLIDPAATGSGTAARARVQDSTGAIVISGLVINTGATPDLTLSPNSTIVAGQTVALTAATITGN